MTYVYKLKTLPSEYMIETQDVFAPLLMFLTTSIFISALKYAADGWISQNVNMTTPE